LAAKKKARPTPMQNVDPTAIGKDAFSFGEEKLVAP
jgi:hypothetical protein